MKSALYCLLACVAFSCHKDVNLDSDNYIMVDGTYFIRPPDSKGKFLSISSNPYYDGVTWRDGKDDMEIEVSVVNTCHNNRGNLSDFHGYITFLHRKGQDSVQY